MKVRRRTLLLVEDEDLGRELMTDLLEMAGYTVSAYANPLEALKHYKNGAYSLIITDLRMEGMNGKEFIKKIRSLDVTTPILVVSGYLDIYIPEDKTEYFLAKPFDKKLFLGQVNHIIEKHT